MEIIETTAPIPIDTLKQYFVNKDIKFSIDYNNSKLKGLKLLTYLSNLDIPTDIVIDRSSPEFLELLKDYFHCPFIINVEMLEDAAIEVLLAKKQLVISDTFNSFIADNHDIIEKWSVVLDSLSIYNMYIVDIDDFKLFCTSHPEDPTDELEGINFVSLLKHEGFYLFYNTIEHEKMKYYSKYFNDYMFKGKNLYGYWANANNPLFLLTWGIAAGIERPLGSTLVDLQKTYEENINA